METVKGKALVLRTCNSDMTSRNGFIWPKSGPVECPDWTPSLECGNGLHGALWGQGNGSLLDWSLDAVWQVVQIEERVDLDGKVKFPRGIVVHTGNRETATKYIIENGASGAVIGASTTAGNEGTATVGFRGTATVGDWGTANAGHGGTAIAGNEGTATAGFRGTATAGRGGTANAGDEGTATAGFRGTATAGRGGTANAGNEGTATVGDRGIAMAGYKGTASAGHCGIIQIKYFDGERFRIKAGYVGEDGIEPNVPYRLDHDGNVIKAG